MTPPDDDTPLLLQASVDGELDAASALAFDRRLASEPDLAAARDGLLALRATLHEAIPREHASAGLRMAMDRAAGRAETRPEGGPEHRPGGRLARMPAAHWRLALAACLFGVLVGSGMTIVAGARRDDPAMAEVVADHLRAVMAPQPFDVASSDQHTVKPWFTGRLTFAPQVFDLAASGFPLAGGRVDVLGGEPAATLVFRHGKHVISLTSQPVASAAPPRRSGGDRGFAVRVWSAGGLRYWAVSDVAADELDSFEAAARARIAEAP